MKAKALVIGIDKYSRPEWGLSGAVRDALRFARWARDEGGVAEQDLTLLLSPLDGEELDDPDLAALGQPATTDAIDIILNDYQKGAGAGADRFWFYYAGHGLAPPGSATDAGPLVVPADVDDIDRYVNRPLGLEMFRGAMQNMPPKEQFFFIDACRDVLPIQGNRILTQQLLWDLRGIDDDSLSTQAVFLATTAGQNAKELRGEGLFGRALIAALRGLGPELLPPVAPPAQGETPRRRLLFDQLVKFVRNAVTQGLKELPGTDAAALKGVPYSRVNKLTGEITVAEFPAASLPRATISAIVDPAAARGAGRIEFLRWDDETGVWIARDRDPAPLSPLPPVATFQLRGGTHHLRVEAAGFSSVTREILVYEDRRFPIRLEASAAAAPPPQPAPATPLPAGAAPEAAPDDGGPLWAAPEAVTADIPGSIYARCPDALARVAVFDGGGRERGRGFGEVSVSGLSPGPYKVTAELTEVDRVEATVSVISGERTMVALDIGREPGPAVQATMQLNQMSVINGYAHPSEVLGAVADLSLASLLAYGAWAARWSTNLPFFHHLRSLGVDPLQGLSRGASAVQVLLGDARDGASMVESRVLVEIGAQRIDVPMNRMPNVPPAVQGAVVLPSGPARVRIDMPGFVPADFAVVLLPDFVTVLVIAREDDGDVEVQQHLNPVDPTAPVAPGFDPARPEDVRHVELAARALENRQPLDSAEAELLLNLKRADPMLGIIAGYRMLGTDHENAFRGTLPPPLDTGYAGPYALWNMVYRFSALPDVHVLAGLYDPERRDEHFQRAAERGTPIMAEGFWTLVRWLTQRAITENTAPPALRESALPGMAWTAFSAPSRAARADAVRIVEPSGRTRFGDPGRTGVIAAAARAVAKIGSAETPVIGTCMLVRPTFVLCPLFAVSIFAERVKEDRTLKDGVYVQFDERDQATIRRVIRVAGVFSLELQGDAVDGSLASVLPSSFPVMLELESAAPGEPLALAEHPPLIGSAVAVIGYPHEDFRVEGDAFSAHFAGASGEKHIMSGTILRLADGGQSFEHDCFTAPGTAGGPVIDVASGVVLGMHVGGLPPSGGRKRGIAVTLTRDFLNR